MNLMYILFKLNDYMVRAMITLGNRLELIQVTELDLCTLIVVLVFYREFLILELNQNYGL